MHPKPLLDLATDLVRRVLQLQYPADAVVSRFFREHRQLGPRERATLSETAWTVLRFKLKFEYLAQSGSGARQRRLAILGFAAPRSFLDGALNPAEKRWFDHLPPDHELPPACLHNLPDWLVTQLQAELPQEFDALAASLLQMAPLDLRVNALQMKRAAAQAALQGEGIATVATPYSPWGLRATGKPALQNTTIFKSGGVEVQDEGSQLLALLLDARRREMVADFCAGAGGKTLAMGATMRSTGRLYAFDVSARRLQSLRPRLARSGLANVHPVAISPTSDERLKRLVGKMDRVLVDVPCSGLGTLRRNPDMKWRQSSESVHELADKQRGILARAARLVKPGGRLVYATCSLLEAENEAVARDFGAEHPDFKPIDAAATLAALDVADAHTLCSPDGLYLRLWPHRHATDGFFAALWQRND